MVDSIPAGRFRLVVGLGNPGRQYEGTRHNVGFAVLDLLAARHAFPFTHEARWKGDCALFQGIMYLKPTTFMNLSGESVGAVARFHRIPPAEILVVLDDVALPPGRLRLRAVGSHGGHNGLRSILDHLGSREVPRLRIGIGDAGGGGRMTGHVLGRFRAEERPALDACVGRAAEAVEDCLKNDLAVAMNLHNKADQPNP